MPTNKIPRMSPTTRDILMTLYRLGLATVEDFSVIREKRKEHATDWNPSRWGYSLLTSGHRANGCNSSLIHRGLIEVVGLKKRSRVFRLTPKGFDLVSAMISAGGGEAR